MRVVELPPGERALEDQNGVIISRLQNGSFDVVDASTAGIWFAPHPSQLKHDALAAALAWAQDRGAELMIVERHHV